MLKNTGKEIVLTVPTKGLASTDDPYALWFSSGIHYAADPEKVRRQYRPPRVLLFQDNDGTVVLVGCRDAGFTSTVGAGHGKIVANFAILGGKSLRYNKINGVRSELPAIVEWTGLRSVHADPEADNQGRVQKVQIKLESPSPSPLNRRMNLNLRPTWRTSFPRHAGTFSAHDIVQLETTSRRPMAWKDHLEQHVAMRDLIVLAGWHPFGFSRLEVNRIDDPETFLSGDVSGPRWARVVTHRVQRHEERDRRNEFLFNFDDIGYQGVRKWLKLRSHFARAIDPVVALADQQGGFWETRMVQSGIALEALGYQLETDNGGTEFNSRGQITYMDALGKILADMSYIPIDDPDDWKQRSRECYMGVKHADNSTPDSLILANTLRENLLVVRFWLASRLGCKKHSLRRRRDLDPLAARYVPVGE